MNDICLFFRSASAVGGEATFSNTAKLRPRPVAAWPHFHPTVVVVFGTGILPCCRPRCQAPASAGRARPGKPPSVGPATRTIKEDGWTTGDIYYLATVVAGKGCLYFVPVDRPCPALRLDVSMDACDPRRTRSGWTPSYVVRSDNLCAVLDCPIVCRQTL
jgi:hypothetical protein